MQGENKGGYVEDYYIVKAKEYWIIDDGGYKIIIKWGRCGKYSC